MNNVVRINMLQKALLRPESIWNDDAAVRAFEGLMRTESLYEVAPRDGAVGLHVTSQVFGTEFAAEIESLFVGFDTEGFSTFTDPYASFLHKVVRSAGAGAFHDGPLFDRDAREGTDVHHNALAPNRIERQMAISTPLARGEAMLIAGYRYDDVPSEDSDALDWLKLLEPAYSAGRRLRAEVARFDLDWARFIEDFPVPAIVVDKVGKVVHRSRKFSALISKYPKLESLHAAAVQIARDLVGKTRRATAMTAEPIVPEMTISKPDFQAKLTGMLLPRMFDDDVCLVEVQVLRIREETTTSLTVRETEVARLLSEGHSDKQIARHLGVSLHTARRHVESIFRKCGVSNRTQASVLLRNSIF